MEHIIKFCMKRRSYMVFQFTPWRLTLGGTERSNQGHCVFTGLCIIDNVQRSCQVERPLPLIFSAGAFSGDISRIVYSEIFGRNPIAFFSVLRPQEYFWRTPPPPLFFFFCSFGFWQLLACPNTRLLGRLWLFGTSDYHTSPYCGWVFGR